MHSRLYRAWYSSQIRTCPSLICKDRILPITKFRSPQGGNRPTDQCLICFNKIVFKMKRTEDFKCNGRTLTKESVCGNIDLTGQIEWDTNKIAKRIGLATFENPSCIKCKMLPLCMGLCSQKLMEVGGFDKQICAMKSVDTSLNDYILQDFRSKTLIKQYQTNNGGML